MHKIENLRFICTNSCSGSQDRAPSPSLSGLCFVNLSCLCSAVFASRRAHSLQRRSLSSLSCDGFGALLEISMFTTNSKTTLNRWIMNKLNYKSVYVRMRFSITRILSAHGARTRALDLRTIHINIFQRNSAVKLTSVGLAHARPNYSIAQYDLEVTVQKIMPLH